MTDQTGSRQAASLSVTGVPLVATNDRGSISGAPIEAEGEALNLAEFLGALQAMKVGDFSVRLPRNQAGLAGKAGQLANGLGRRRGRVASSLIKRKSGRTGGERPG